MDREQVNVRDQYGPYGGSVTYDPTTGAQTTAVGQPGQEMAGNLQGAANQYFGMAGQGVPDTNAGFQQAASFYDANMDPRIERGRSAMESRLRNQGLDPSSAAYQSAMGDLSLQNAEARNNWMAGAQNQFYNQGLQSRQQTLAELSPGLQYGIPAFMDPNVSPYQRINTGGAFNAPGAMQNNFNQQLSNYNNQMSGFSGLAGIGLKAALGPGGFFV